LKEELRRLLGEREIPEFVDDEEFHTGEVLQGFVVSARELSVGQDLRDLFGGEEDTVTGLGSFDAKGHGQMSFAHTGRPVCVHPLRMRLRDTECNGKR